jgi:hypothetical protein
VRLVDAYRPSTIDQPILMMTDHGPSDDAAIGGVDPPYNNRNASR